MKKLKAIETYIIFTALMLLYFTNISASDITPYAELNTENDDYALTFRSTCDGMELWHTNLRLNSSPQSRSISISKVSGDKILSTNEMEFPLNQNIDRSGNSKYLDGSPSFDACNPNYGVFVSNRLYNSKDYGNDIYEMEWDGNKWNVRRIDEINTNAWDDTPSLSPDGKYLYFSSDRKSLGKGETDIFVSQKVNNKWTNPIALESICEAKIREQTPLASVDGFLYYASDKSGDFDIWRVKIDPSSGMPIASTNEPIPFEKVNQKGSDEGHPAFSPGLQWFIFSSNKDSEDRSYDLFYTKLEDRKDQLHLKVLLRTQEFNKDFEEYEDITTPFSDIKVQARDLATNNILSVQTDSKGELNFVFEGSYNINPSIDRRIRQIEVKAILNDDSLFSSCDTLIYEMGYDCELEHTLFVWDSRVLTNPDCRQTFAIKNVEFFVSAYWCPTTRKYANLTPCQTPFFEPTCLEIETPKQACPDNELYNFKVVPARVERIRQRGLCADLSEIEKHGEKWSANVDEAIEQFIDKLKSGLKKPCIQRSIKANKKIKIEVIGWTDPRGISNDCLYTGSDINFKEADIYLNGWENKRYIKNGILKNGTRFIEAPVMGNQLLSELRAFNTAILMDQLWKSNIPLYEDLRQRGLIEIVATGKAVMNENLSFERRRSVSVTISSDISAEPANSRNMAVLGSSIALCGNQCLSNLLCRPLEKTVNHNEGKAIKK